MTRRPLQAAVDFVRGFCSGLVISGLTALAAYVAVDPAVAQTVSTLVNFVLNVRNAQNSDYTIVATDGGKTLALGGNAFFTLTLPAASTMPANFFFIALNEDTWGSGRGKIIAPNGKAPFILWPGLSNAAHNSGESSSAYTRSHRPVEQRREQQFGVDLRVEQHVARAARYPRQAAGRRLQPVHRSNPRQ